MQPKTFKSAIVIIPPQDKWDTIQSIRREYDSKIKRWMPHITLVYPFWPKEDFNKAKSLLAPALSAFPSFSISLREIFYFSHGLQNYTLWLGPEPKGKIMELHDTLSGILPEDDNPPKKEAFHPHLSIGQIKGKEKLQKVCAEIKEYWQTVTFSVDKIYLIWRKDPPYDEFQVGEEIDLKVL